MITSEELLWAWLRFGWRYRGISSRPQAEQDWYAERVRYEAGLITSKDLQDFFLATSDMVRWAKDHGIPVGPGRGSVAASVVAWLLRITEVDPHRYPSLMFERFLDINRADPPDIDLDFADQRRQEVFAYMASRYGAECVGTVANFVRYRGKNSLVDVARVYNIPHWAKETVANLLVERSGGDSRFNASIEDTVAMFPAAAAVFEQYPDFWKAVRLEGNYRGYGTHAAGMIVANSPLTDVFSVLDRDGRAVLGNDKYDVEHAGALKMDCLGLTTMGIIATCLEMTGLSLEDLYAIRDDDREALQIFKSGDVTGIFQFEGRATRLVNRDVSPDNFREVTDVNALSRPGPLFSGTTAEYVDVKHGRRTVERFHPVIDEITMSTRGCIIYQEQILQIVRDVGGFDWGHSIEIRRIISKKMGEAAMGVSMGRFVEGAERIHGINEKDAQRVWKRLVTSGTYAFVYAHSVSYSILGLWTAWLKAHHPVHFYAASLGHTDDKEVAFRLMKDAQAHGIEIRPPMIGVSGPTWKADGESLVAGWRQIPKVGPAMSEKIAAFEADTNGSIDWEDLTAIRGVGAKTVDRLREFAEQDDPFELAKTDQAMAGVRDFLAHQRGIPKPTHNGTEVAAIHVEQDYGALAKKNYGKGPRVVYAGLVRERNMQDAVENRRSRTGAEESEILATLKSPHLREYCSLRCYDDTDEEVYLRVHRFKFPELKRAIQSITPGHDAVVCVGNRIAGFGTPVMVDKLYVIDPD